MAYCSYCAAVLEVNQPVCSRCGHAVGVAPTPPVAPPPAPLTVSERPPSVRWAGILLLISCAVSLLSLVNVSMRSHGAVLQSLAFLIPTVAILVVWIALVACIWQRQGWARFAILLLLAWNILNMILSLLRIAASGRAVWGFAVALALSVLRMYAVYLLFKPESNAWFKK